AESLAQQPERFVRDAGHRGQRQWWRDLVGADAHGAHSMPTSSGCRHGRPGQWPKRASTSVLVGMASAAPSRSTLKAATRQAWRTAAWNEAASCAIADASAPLNASPAPVVSRADTDSAGTR